MGEQAEGVGIALEVGDVVPERGRHLLAQREALALGEEGLYGFLAGVAEGRVAHIVGQTGRSHDLSYFRHHALAQLRLALAEAACYVAAQRHAHAGHLERMGEAVVYEDAARQREHLRLVLHAAKGCREDESVVVALELGAVVVTLRMAVFLSEPLGRDELFPVHCHAAKVVKVHSTERIVHAFFGIFSTF